MTSSEKSISRRSFLGLTGAAATITAAAGLYGCAQPASSSGGSLASTKGSAAGPIEAVSAPASWDEEADVSRGGHGRRLGRCSLCRASRQEGGRLGEGEHLGRQLEGDGQLQRHGNQDPAGHLSRSCRPDEGRRSGRSGGAVRADGGARSHGHARPMEGKVLREAQRRRCGRATQRRGGAACLRSHSAHAQDADRLHSGCH